MSLLAARDIRSALKKHISSLPKNGRGEVTRIAAALSVSTTLISQVLAGSKVLTPEQAQLLIEYLGVTGIEADYLTFLNQFERAGSSKLKGVWSAKLEELRKKSLKISQRVSVDRNLNEEERAVFYSSALYSAIRLYCSITNRGKTLAEICDRFDIPRGRAVEILKVLIDTGLCSIENDRYSMGLQKTHLEQGSPHLLKHHANWRLRAIQQSESLSEQELMYTCPVSLSRKDFELLREEMVQFIERFLSQVHESASEEIACFNMDFFWIKK